MRDLWQVGAPVHFGPLRACLGQVGGGVMGGAIRFRLQPR
jgi:hypothetical protein